MQKKYGFLPFAAKVLRIVAWIVLVVGVIGSIVLGITTGGIEEWIILVFGSLVWEIITGGIEGGFLPVIGIIGSFLAWLLLLAASELFKLFMDVKENTINTAESITKESC